MSDSVYRLKDLQKVIDLKKASQDVLSIQPLEVNYITDKDAFLHNRYIYKVYPFFKKSVLPLKKHLKTLRVTDQCFVKLSDTDVELLNQEVS